MAESCIFAAEYVFLPALAPDCTGTIAKPALSARAESEDFWFRKRPCGGSCDERVNPSRSAVPEFRPRGRGQLQLNRSICWVTTFDAGPVRRIQLSQPTPSARLATLILDGLSFIPLLTAERKGKLTNLVRGCAGIFREGARPVTPSIPP